MNITPTKNDMPVKTANTVSHPPGFTTIQLTKTLVLPALSVSGSDFVLNLAGFSLQKGDVPCLMLSTSHGEKFEVNSRLQVVNGQTSIVFQILSLKIPVLEKASFFVKDQVIDISELFSQYRLDRQKLTDDVYLTRAIFNAGVRKFSGDGLFVVSYVYLDAIANDNPNYGGFITMLSYRITDKLAERAHLLHKLYTTYLQYRDVVDCHDGIAFRWLVSCSSALTTALLAAGNVAQAADVAEGALQRIVHPGLNPMVHQNYVLLLFQAGLIKASQKQFHKAACLFITAVNASRHGIIDLLHPQNDWVLSQLNDCHKLLHVAEAAHIAAIACTRNKLPPQSRFARLSSVPRFNLNFQLLFDRFTCFKRGQLPAFFEQVSRTLQTHLEGSHHA